MNRSRHYQTAGHTLLLAAAMAAMTWAVLAGGWLTGVAGAGKLVWVAAMAVAEAFVVTRLRARVAVVLAAPLLAYVVVIPLTIGYMPDAAQSSFGEIMGRYLGASVYGLTATDVWTFVTGLAVIVWVIAYALTCLSLGARRTALGTVAAFGALGINALNAHNPGQVMTPTLVTAALLLIAIASGEFQSLRLRWRRTFVTTMPRVGRRFAMQAVVAVAMLFGISLLIPPVSSTDFSRDLFRAGPQSILGQPAPQTVAFSPDVRPGGSLASHPQTLFTYTSTVSDPYLRVENDLYFQDGNWTAAIPGRPLTGYRVPAGPIPRDSDPSSGGLGKPVQSADVALTFARSDATGPQALGIFPGDPTRASVPVEAIGIASDAGLLTVDQVTLDQGVQTADTATFTGVVPAATEAQLRAAGTDYPAFVQPLMTWQTGGQATTIQGLARAWTAGTTNPYDAATAIENHLRSNAFKYSLEPPLPSDSSWPITYFLTQSHIGYCQYFASSMGAMLRSLGIPTRLVTGFGPGSLAFSVSGTAAYTVTTSDAHSWVEAYFPRYGWIPFEPTPPSILGDYKPLTRGAAAPPPTPTPLPTAAPATARPTPRPTQGPAPVQAAPSSAFHLPGYVMPALLILALLALAGFTAMRWLRAPKNVDGVWRRLGILARVNGVRPRHPSHTHAEFADHWIETITARRGGCEYQAELRGIAELSGKDRFSSAGLDHREQDKLVASWLILLRGSRHDIGSRLPRRRGRRSAVR